MNWIADRKANIVAAQATYCGKLESGSLWYSSSVFRVRKPSTTGRRSPPRSQHRVLKRIYEVDYHGEFKEWAPIYYWK